MDLVSKGGCSAVYHAIATNLEAIERIGLHPIAVVDIPLLYETNHAKDFDRVIVTTCTRDHQIARLRIAQSPEGRRIFPRMSVAENLQMGADATGCSEAERAAGLERIFALFPRLKERMTQRGGTLSGGEQQMLAIGRALMSRPRLLMLDEPSLGLAPLIARQIFDAIRTLNRQDGLTVLIVEQNANHALKLAHRGYVMVNGLITLSGTGSELLQRPEIRAAYLEGGRRA